MMDSKEAKQRMVEGRLYLPFRGMILEKFIVKKFGFLYNRRKSERKKRKAAIELWITEIFQI